MKTLYLYKVCISSGLEFDCIGDGNLDLHEGDKVIIRCERYQDFGTLKTDAIGEPRESEADFEKLRASSGKGRHIEGQKIPLILRRANDEDLATDCANQERASGVHVKAMERIRFHNLDMKLIHTHYSFDRKLLLFQFSAEGRIDFRELVRDLSSMFHVRVELRQVGVRDEAAILGGIGSCGRPFCCASFLPSFNSINVKMAKQQGLSLNPQNISGCCGRLKCCLQYEADLYQVNGCLHKPPAGKEKTATVPDDDSPDLEPTPPRAESNRPAGKNRGQFRPPNQDKKPKKIPLQEMQ
ncbi:MAG: hypothetical protein GX902_12805 [Lentisphaerae bacterium]|nr:hypothetical protein [Lentisphaerota bacterium]